MASEEQRMEEIAAGERSEASSAVHSFSRLHMACALICLLGILAVARWLHADPRGFGTHQQLGFPPCLTREYIGLPCPFCGMTTAFALMAHGKPVDAFCVQPVGALAFVGTVVACFALAVLLVIGRRFPRHFADVALSKYSRYLWIPVLLAWIYKVIATTLHFP